MTAAHQYKIAVVWRGDAEARRNATPQNNRFFRIFEELAALGMVAEPAVFDESFAEAVRAQLMTADGVLVWVDPLHEGKNRTVLDALLRDVAAHGPWVSAHPDTILRMGTKEVLYRTQHVGWGTDIHLYRTAAELRAAFPQRLRMAGPRVLKQNRGRCRSSGMRIFSTARAPPRARTPTCCARSMSALCSRSPDQAAAAIAQLARERLLSRARTAAR